MTTSERIAERITAASGSMSFLLFNGCVFILWIAWNTLLPAPWHFDPYPFSCLTMVVSLEAIFLTLFVLITQNRQAAADRAEVARDAATNRKALAEIHTLKQQVSGQQEEITHTPIVGPVREHDPSWQQGGEP